jgi:hypothetical protein
VVGFVVGQPDFKVENGHFSDPALRQDLPPLFDDHLTATVANCFSGPQTDEGIQVASTSGVDFS